MSRHSLSLLDDYEVIGHPVVSHHGLAYVSWVEEAVRPYNATQLPHGPVQGLLDAIRRCAPGTSPTLSATG